MKISKIIIHNFRNIQVPSLDINGTTIFIGENNSGKSNMLRAITLPLFSDDNAVSKNLSWEDINNAAKEKYYKYIFDHRQEFIDGTVDIEKFKEMIPFVSVELRFTVEEGEFYYVKDLAFGIENGSIQYGLLYSFYIETPTKLIEVVSSVLSDTTVSIESVKRNLLPINLFTHSISVPQKNSKVSYDTLKQFKYTLLPAERDGFSNDGNRIGYRSLVKLLEAKYSAEDLVCIESEYQSFFDAVKKIGDVDRVINWQNDSDIPNAKEFIDNISILPNMPPLSTILNGVKLGYADESLSLQGLGYRNLILLLVLLNSWEKQQLGVAINVLIMEEPEAHLCINNIRLMCSFINSLTKENKKIQMMFASHSIEFINKHDLSNIVILDAGQAFALLSELKAEERDYLSKNPNTDIYKLFLSHRCILVEGFTEELLIKAYIHSCSELDDIDVLSFHKGFEKIIDIWIKTNGGGRKKLGVVRDFDDQTKAKEAHEKYNAYPTILIKTTAEYTLEPEIVNAGKNYQLLKDTYGECFGWKDLSKEELSDDWRSKKSDVMLRISQDLSNGKLIGFTMPQHIKTILDFMIGKKHEN